MEIKVRSKFVKGFQDCLEEAKRILCELLEQSPTFIVRLIWMLTYDPMLENYHKPDYQKWLERITSLVSSEKLDLFKNEVMYHLSRLQKDFFNLNIKPQSERTYAYLQAQVGKAGAYIIFTRCLEFSYHDENSINRCLRLLSKHYEDSILKGVKSLGFNSEESYFLIPYASEIHNLLYDLTSEKLEVKGNMPEIPFFFSSHEDGGETANLSVEESSQVDISVSTQETSNEEALKVAVEEPTTAVTNSLSPVAILSNTDLISSFFKILDELHSAGINFEELIQKREAISNLLAATKLFEG